MASDQYWLASSLSVDVAVKRIEYRLEVRRHDRRDQVRPVPDFKLIQVDGGRHCDCGVTGNVTHLEVQDANLMQLASIEIENICLRR